MPTRRRFLQQTAGLTAAVAATRADAATADPLLPTVKLGPHAVTRLIVGGNPVYGHSHFNRLLSQHMTDWHTPERVVELLTRCERAGINTWQNSYAERTLEDLDRYREAGGTMHWLCLGKPDWDKYPGPHRRRGQAQADRHRPARRPGRAAAPRRTSWAC